MFVGCKFLAPMFFSFDVVADDYFFVGPFSIYHLLFQCSPLLGLAIYFKNVNSSVSSLKSNVT